MSKTLWAIIILIVIAVGGWFVYRSANSSAPLATTGQPDQAAQTTTPTPTAAATVANHDNIYLTSTDPAKGTYLTDFSNVTLYTFDKDSIGSSTCYDACAINWPPYTSGATKQGSFPTGISIVHRADGIDQFAWQGKPLYYYTKDIGPGKLFGDGIGSTWHIVKM